jgi:tetratricopeptide (TPR) repeat protein
MRSQGFTPAVDSPTDELTEAESLFRRAVELEPGLGTARLRLGRVLGLLGRHGEAVDELRLAQSSLIDPRDRYFGELFLGAEELAAGRATEARTAFQSASALFPNAQSPYLALGQLAWQQADRADGEFVVDALAALPRDRAGREDPWWSYDVSVVLDFPVLVDHLRQMAAAEQVRK